MYYNSDIEYPLEQPLDDSLRLKYIELVRIS